MADGVTLPGTGVLVYSDDLGAAGQCQGLKVVTGANNTDGGYVTEANPLPVKALGVIVTKKVSVIRPADTAVYAALDALANSTSAPTAGGFTISGAARASGGSGQILEMAVSSSANPGTRLSGELILLDQAGTAVNDNAAFAMTVANIKNMIGIIPFSLMSMGSGSFAHVMLNVAFTCVGTADLRFLVRVRNVYTPISAEELQFIFKILQVD